ncbi:MAG: M50 family metallopeptidase [Patescibacteria group bacterium]
MIISAITSILIFLLVLSFLILIHEMGHFLASKYLGIVVEEFGLGYPPRAKELFKKWNTSFTLNWIPFGGFVRIYGEEATAAANSKSQLSNNKKNQKAEPFYSRPALQRLTVILAGPMVNLLFGAIAFSIFYSFVGIPSLLENQARISYISPKSPAEEAGLQIDTNIIALKDSQEIIAINSIEAAVEAITNHKGQRVTLFSTGKCEQDLCQEMVQEYEVYIRKDEEIENPQLEGALGVAFQTQYLKFYSWYEMPLRGALTGLKESLFLIILTVQELGKMLTNIFHGAIPEDVRGPFGIGHVVVKNRMFNEGFLSILRFSGLLSVGLAIMNLLPIPALDGGRALFILLEKVIGKKRVNQFETKANYGGFIILLSLIVLITVRDIWRIALDIYHYFA